jgi:HEAT repeat protein
MPLRVQRFRRIEPWYAAWIVVSLCIVGFVAIKQAHGDRVTWLIERLKNSDASTRQHAAFNLLKTKDPRVVEPLITALTDPNDYVRILAADELGYVGDPRAVGPLIANFKDVDGNSRASAAEALGKIGAPAVEPLIASLKSPDEEVSGLAAQALGDTGDRRAIGPLIEAMKDYRSRDPKTSRPMLWLRSVSQPSTL